MVKVGDKGELEKKQTGETNKNEKKRNIKSTISESDFIHEKEKIIADLKIKLKQSEDRVLRELAENENIRKRYEKQTIDNLKYAVKNFSYDLLNVTDNFQRALNSIPKNFIDENSNLKSLFVGLQAVEKEIYEIFEKNGITRFESINCKFDPEKHQAVSKKESEIPEGHVAEELQKGFMIGDRLLRPAMVVISSGKQQKK